MKQFNKSLDILIMKNELKKILFGLLIIYLGFTFIFWALEPAIRELFKGLHTKNDFATGLLDITFNYFVVGLYYLILITIILMIGKKLWAIRKYKKLNTAADSFKVPSHESSELKVQREERPPVYIMEQSKSISNKYSKTDTENIKRLFNQNNTVSINSGVVSPDKLDKPINLRKNESHNHTKSSLESSHRKASNIAIGVSLGVSTITSLNSNSSNSTNSSDSSSSCGGE